VESKVGGGEGVRIVVASGKGGTGKTIISLGLALASDGVTLLDCDVEEPDCHLFMEDGGDLVEEVTIPVVRINEGRCTHEGLCARTCQYHALAVLPNETLVFDELCHGCGACVIVCPEEAISEERRRIGELRRLDHGNLRLVWGLLDIGKAMATPIIRRLKEVHSDGGLQILDSPPGTACPVVETIRGADYCVLVTEPTPFGMYDLSLAIDLVRELGVPFGVVVNRDRDDAGELNAFLDREGIEVLMRIPDDLEIARLYARGVHFATEMDGWMERFKQVLDRIIGGGPE
jgi:MinD superfamily P-loop ATPase